MRAASVRVSGPYVRAGGSVARIWSTSFGFGPQRPGVGSMP
jgi:hypothetical protein